MPLRSRLGLKSDSQAVFSTVQIGKDGWCRGAVARILPQDRRPESTLNRFRRRMTMQDRPNERLDAHLAEQPRDGASREQADPRNDTAPQSARPTRWVQLAYDLEQYGDGESEHRGEVY